MDFVIKKQTKEEFIETYIQWLEKHNFPLNVAFVLPQTFFVCYYKEIPIYAVPFWNTDSAQAIIAFIVSNKEVDYKTKEGGIEFLLDNIFDYAINDNYLSIYTSTANEKLKKIFINKGFVVGDSDTSQLFKNL